MAQKLLAEELIDQARKDTALERFDSDSFREGLDVYLEDLNAGEPNDAAYDRLRQHTVQVLANRLKTTGYLDSRPELLERPVERPVFVFGIPRTGTTLLSNLLATDPARRSPLTWEIDDPVPPATRATLQTDPRALERLEFERQMLEARPEMGKYYRSSAIYPNECVFFMAHDFKTLMLESRCTTLIYRDWLLETDMTSAYRYHKRFLQLLQAEAPGNWNLKMPSHALWLEALLQVYPDARLVWTHRDPYTALGSFCSIISLSHTMFQTGVKPDWIGDNCLWQLEQHMHRIMDFREKFGEDRVIDVHYAEMVENPVETMRGLYGVLGDEFSADVEQGMRSWLDENPQDKFGKHEYKLAEFGLTRQRVAPVLERYMARYEVRREG